MLEEQNLLNEVNKESIGYPQLAGKGEMVQEKTNNQKAFMFGELLDKLKEHRNIFEIVSAATFRGR